MGLVFVLFFRGLTSGLYSHYIFCSRAKYNWADDSEERNVGSEVCFACLNWFYGKFVRTLISRTNAYAGCSRSTLTLNERFWLGSVRSAFKLNSKCSQMNYTK